MTLRAAVLVVVLLLLPQGAPAQAPPPPVAETVAIPLIEERLLGPRELHLEAHDGHILLPGEIRAWRSAMVDFLARLGLGEP